MSRVDIAVGMEGTVYFSVDPDEMPETEEDIVTWLVNTAEGMCPRMTAVTGVYQGAADVARAKALRRG